MGGVQVSGDYLDQQYGVAYKFQTSPNKVYRLARQATHRVPGYITPLCPWLHTSLVFLVTQYRCVPGRITPLFSWLHNTVVFPVT